MKKLRNIFLIGPMGAGKSTIGKYLAKELKLEFYDTDQEIEKRTGVEIAWIYDVEGESGFRRRETQIIRELVEIPNIVLATGGGAIDTAENRTILAARGTVIYLDASLEQQLQRLEKDTKRPVLQQEGELKQILLDLQKKRDPLYREIADYIYATDDSSVRAVANGILKQLKEDEDANEHEDIII